MKLLNGKYKIRNRIMAAFLAVTMLLTLVPTGQMQVYAAGEGKVNVDSFAGNQGRRQGFDLVQLVAG